MNITISDAEAKLPELINRAEAGEEVVLVRRGRPVARIIALHHPEMTEMPPDLERRRLRLLELSQKMALQKKPESDAAHAADFLYDEFGLPG